MSDQDFSSAPTPQDPPLASQDPQPARPFDGVPPAHEQTAAAPYPDAGFSAGGPTPPPTRARTRGWVWLLVGTVCLAILIGSCAWSVAIINKGPSGATLGGDKIAVIPIDAEIAGTGSATGMTITPEGFLDQIQQATDDENVKAILLRVDSPGGTVAASEEISAYVKDARKEKPVVVSIGDVGASGAYMVASQADQIIALPGSAVGSIGVITEIPNVSGLMDKLGVQFVVITAGEYKDAGSPFRALTASETALIQGQVDDVYDQFIDIVAEGRDMKRSEVEKLATGWAWSGTEAKKLGLVDKIGTYQDALDEAAKLGGIEGKDYDVVTYDSRNIDTLLTSLLGIESQLRSLTEAVSPGQDARQRTVVPR